MIEQIGHHGEKDFRPKFDLSIGDRCRQMRFAATRWAAQQQPEGRFFGVAPTLFK